MTDPRQISVVIAEDEPLILNNIAKKVEHSSGCFTVIRKAASGLEVLAFLEKQPADILITDIEMPGMNGLELIKEVTSRFPSVRIVILSGYNNFEYARTAMHYGVKEYLLKPVVQGELAEVLEKLAEEIRQDKQTMERNILSRAVLDVETEEKPPACFEGKSFLLSLITLGNLPSRYVQPHYTASLPALWEQIDFAACIRDLTSVSHFWLIDEACCLQKMLILHMDGRGLSPSHANILLFRHLRLIMGSVPFHIVTTDKSISYREIWSCAKELREYTSQTTLLHTQDHSICAAGKGFSLEYKRQKDRTDLLYQITSPQELTSYILDTLCQYEKDRVPQQYAEAFLHQCYQLLPGLFSLEESSCRQAMSHVLASLQESQDIRQLSSQISESVTELFQNHWAQTDADSLPRKIREYIDGHYQLEITAESLSRRYGYTPSYINRIFKKDSGVTPLQYVTMLRIRRAKELLLENMDIKKIAAATGYEDARYFSRVFKNETGLTPSAWALGASENPNH